MTKQRKALELSEEVKVVRVGVDNGKSSGKAALLFEDGSYTVLDSFPTEVEENYIEDGKYVVEFGSRKEGTYKRYLVGEKKESLSKNKTSLDKGTDVHRICALTSICLLLEETGNADADIIEMTINMPLNLYKQVKEREETRKLYETAPGEKVTMSVNGQTYSFEVRCTPYFECLGTVLANEEMIEEKGMDLVCLNFGSLNVNCATFDCDGEPVSNRSYCVELGCTGLIKEIQNRLYAVPSIKKNLPESIIRSLILKQNTLVSPEVVDTVDSIVMSYLDSVYSELTSLGAELEYLPILVSGGGALLFGDYLNRIFKGKIYIAEDPVNSDAVGSTILLG